MGTDADKMDFKEGDICYTHFVNIEECKILKAYPNTKRYKILQCGWERMISASKIFHTKNDVVENLIEVIDHRITKLEEQKAQIIVKYK